MPVDEYGATTWAEAPRMFSMVVGSIVTYWEARSVTVRAVSVTLK